MIRPSTLGPFLRGINASTDPYSIPKGAVPRASNLLMIDRGALTPVDGTSLINAFNGDVQSNRGRFLATTLFSPQGVAPYYMALAAAPDRHLGPPHNLTSSLTTGTLTGTYKYVVTALDGAGGETTASNEVTATPAAQGVVLTWNAVPNAYGYNIYRTVSGGGAGTENLLIASNLPVLQPSPITATVTYTDGGIAAPFPPAGYTISSAYVNFTQSISGSIILTLSTPNTSSFYLGKDVVVSGVSDPNLNTAAGFVLNILDSYRMEVSSGDYNSSNVSLYESGTGGNLADPGSPPLTDTTGQTALFLFPLNSVSYSNANIVGLFPASPSSLGTSSAGSQAKSTPSGGVPGMVGMLPQFKQFTNRLIFSLGNGFPPQAFWDGTGTSTNPATGNAIASFSVSGDQVTVTLPGSATLQITDPTGASGVFMPVGSNVDIGSATDGSYIGVFTVIAVTPGVGGSFVVRNLSASGGAATGTFQVFTTPLISTFIPAYAKWTTGVNYATGSVVVPATQPSPPIYLTAVQGGTSAGSEPSWPSSFTPGKDINVADGSQLIWHVAGLLNSAAPAPPGAGHIEVYDNSLWLFNTYYTNTATGLDGPCSLRMSSVGNPFSYNPVNQAFIDKDDGYEGMGMGKFTITALGIPPEGSLVLVKNRSPYQIIGVFGSDNFAIQAVSSDMGCVAPRTLLFVPGFGITRMTHLGIAVFDGVKDVIISEDIRPYFFPVNDNDSADISVVDPSFMPISWAALTSNPPQYSLFSPVSTSPGLPVAGSSSGQLTRSFLFDLILKKFVVADFPFPLSCAAQVQSQSNSTPTTIVGGWSDGTLQRWQGGDVQWYTGSVSPGPSAISWSVRLPDLYSQNPDQKMQCRRLVIRGISTGANSLSVTPIVNGIQKSKQNYRIPTSGDFDVFAGVMMTGLRFSAIVSGSGHLEIDRVIFHLTPKATGIPSVVS